MKILLRLFAGLIYLFSCNDKPPEWIDENLLPNNTYWGTASAIVNGENHICISAATTFNNRINISILFEVVPDYLRHAVRIAHLPKSKGKYLLPDRVPLWDEQPENVSFGWFSGDAVVASYLQLIDSTFILDIVQLDTLTGVLSGTYSGVFVKEFPLDQINGPDTVRVEQGIFKTKISKP